jgi:RHS repeat-associated protein
VYKTGGFKRLTTAAIERGSDVIHERLFFDNNEINITEAGFLYIWLSNENDTPVEVYFDDFKVMHTKSPVVQSDDYYPFGLTFNSYSRESSIPNKYLYNKGSERQVDLDLGVYQTHYRFLDPAIGRWWQVDPKATKQYELSVYNSMGNNPIRYNDPLGDVLNVSALYAKDKEGNLLYKDKVEAFEKFASTKQGKKFLLSYAEKGFELKGAVVKGLHIKANSEGDNSKKGVDYTYKYAPEGSKSPWTSPKLKNGRMEITTNILTNQQNGHLGKLGALDNIDEVAHESLLHGSLQTKRFLDGEKTDRMKIMGPDHQTEILKSSPYYTEGLEILNSLQSEIPGKNFSSDYLFYNIMLPGTGQSKRTDIKD